MNPGKHSMNSDMCGLIRIHRIFAQRGDHGRRRKPGRESSPKGMETMSSAGREMKAAPRGVNLVELLLVVIIIGIIASIAIPRASRGSRVPGDPELVSSLAVLRTAIEEYAADHEGRFPGTNADRTVGDATLFVGQMTKFTSVTGDVSDIRTSTHRFGPYIRHGIPHVPVGGHKGEWQVAIDVDNLMPKVDMTRPAGWIYNPLTGDIIANADGTDEEGQLYCNY